MLRHVLMSYFFCLRNSKDKRWSGRQFLSAINFRFSHSPGNGNALAIINPVVFSFCENWMSEMQLAIEECIRLTTIVVKGNLPFSFSIALINYNSRLLKTQSPRNENKTTSHQSIHSKLWLEKQENYLRLLIAKINCWYFSTKQLEITEIFHIS